MPTSADLDAIVEGQTVPRPSGSGMLTATSEPTRRGIHRRFPERDRGVRRLRPSLP